MRQAERQRESEREQVSVGGVGKCNREKQIAGHLSVCLVHWTHGYVGLVSSSRFSGCMCNVRHY